MAVVRWILSHPWPLATGCEQLSDGTPTSHATTARRVDMPLSRSSAACAESVVANERRCVEVRSEMQVKPMKLLCVVSDDLSDYPKCIQNAAWDIEIEAQP